MNSILLLINVILQLIPGYVFAIYLFQNYVRFPLRWTLLSLFIHISFISVFAIYIYDRAEQAKLKVLFFLINAVALMVLYFLTKGIQFFMYLFVIFIYGNFMSSLTLIAKIWDIHHEKLYYANIETALFKHTIRAVLVSIIYLPMIFIFIKKLIKPLVDTTKHLLFWKYLWIIPLCFYFIHQVTIYPGAFTEQITWNNQYYLLLISWIGGTFLSYYVILQMIAITVKNATLEENLHIMELQTTMEQEQYLLLQNNIEEMRRARHDLRHHIIVMKSYLEKNDIDGVKDYLNSYWETLELNKIVAICSNYAVNTILNHYLILTKEQHITFTLQVNLPEELPIPSIDICVVLSNLLENAYEACQRQRNTKPFIKLNFSHIGNKMLVLTIQNSFEGIIREKDGQFISSKRESIGIGTSSVKHIVQKYNGISKFSYENQIFEASIMLNA